MLILSKLGINYRYFGESLTLRRKEWPQSLGSKNQPKKKKKPAEVELEDRSDMFLRNVGLSPNYTTL
jgi:hypothetical protein